jgi:lipopolysaccharide export LptBFGC system permease protein LptF
MKILDRYVISSFLKNYLLSFMILVGLYVVLDMLFNFDDLMAIQTKSGYSGTETIVPLLKTIADYYFYQIFLFFVQLSGIIPIVAAAFTLMRMSRQNELSAILSAGVPLLRVALPIIIAAVVLNALLLVDQELVIPQMIPKLVRSHNEAGQAMGSAFQIQSMQDEHHNLLLAAKYYPDPQHPYMREVTIIERDENLLPVAQVTAERADWEPAGGGTNDTTGQWRLTNAMRVSGLQPGGRQAVDRDYDQPYNGGVTPEDVSLYRNADYVNLLSTEKINQMLVRQINYGANQLLRVKHTRFTQPLINIILLLLAIPCVLTREPGRLKSAAMKCLILSGLCLGTVFLCTMVAGRPPNPDWADRWPAVMAWVPIILFGPVAVWLLDRVET